MNYKLTKKSEVPNSDWPRKWFNLNRLLIIIFSLALFLGLANLVGTNALATQGIVLDQILKETESVAKESQILSVEIGKITNLGYIESTAEALGFRRIKNSYIVTPPEAVASALR